MTNSTTRNPLGYHGNVASPELVQDPADHLAPTALSGGAAVLTAVFPSGWRHRGYGIVEYYSDAAGATPVDPTAGTETIVMTPYLLSAGTPATATIADQGDWSGGVLDHATASPQGFDWRTPTKTVEVTLAGIVGATHARLRAEALLV